MKSSSDPISKLLLERDVLLADGAMGTNLFDLGLANGAPGELWNVDRPDDVRSVHRGFVEAGSDIILTNTFGANRFRFALHKLQGRVGDLNRAGAALARDIADGAGRLVVVAGSMGPTGDVLEPLGARTQAEAEEAFYEQAEALRAGGADVAWIETMFADNELEASIELSPVWSIGTHDLGDIRLQTPPVLAAGVVIDENGRPLANATVYLPMNSQARPRTTTNERGEFTLRSTIPLTEVALTVSLTGHEELHQVGAAGQANWRLVLKAS